MADMMNNNTGERQSMGQSLYSQDTRKDQGSMYEKGLDASGAIMGFGMQSMAQMAASGGNQINLDRGVAYLAASNRKPLQTRNSQIDFLGGSKYENGGM